MQFFVKNRLAKTKRGTARHVNGLNRTGPKTASGVRDRGRLEVVQNPRKYVH